VKIIDYIKSYLYLELRLIVTYCYLVYKVTKEVLEIINQFKYYIKVVYNIIL